MFDIIRNFYVFYKNIKYRYLKKVTNLGLLIKLSDNKNIKEKVILKNYFLSSFTKRNKKNNG